MTRGPDKQFDREVALRQAMELFWKQGYEATGVSDLLEHMGIGRQSLYDTFGNKRSLYVAAVGAYLAERHNQMSAVLRSPGSPLERLHALFEQWARMLKETGGVGCLMGNTAIELGPHDVEVANIVRAGLTQIGELLAETIRRGQEAGEIRGGTTPEDLASMLVAAAQGSAVLAKVEPGMEKSRAAIRAVLDLLRAR